MKFISGLVTRRPWVVLTTAAVLLVAALFAGSGVADSLTVGGFEDPSTESGRADALLEEVFGAGTPNLAILVTAQAGPRDRAVAEAATRLTHEIAAEPGLADVESFWTLDLTGFRSPHPLEGSDGKSALVIGRVLGDIDTAQARAAEIAEKYDGTRGPLRLQVGGQLVIANGVIEQADADLDRAELLTAPLTIVVLIIVFGGILAAAVPAVIAVSAVVGTFALLALLAGTTDVSIFALNLTTAMAAALGVDYALVIVSRHREELQRGREVPAAVAKALATAGRSVLFSAGTTIVSLAALLLFPVTYLRSFAFAGMAVIVICSATAIIVVPALLILLGNRLRPKHSTTRPGSDLWRRQAERVQRHPWIVIIGSVVVLVSLVLPARRLEVSRIDDRVLPTGNEIRDLHDELRDTIALEELFAIEVILPGYTPDRSGELDAFIVGPLASIAEVARVDSSIGFYSRSALGFSGLPPQVLPESAQQTAARFMNNDGRGAWLRIVPSVDPVGPEAEELVAAIRELGETAPFELLVTGEAARLADTAATITSHVPGALILIALATYLLMFLMTGSLLVPLKAVVLNGLSLGGMLGAMVWVFQDGNLAGLLGFTPTGTIDVFTPILMVCVAFGLSMDYEVFVLARIKEEYDLTGENDLAVANGLHLTGRIVTAAALLLAVVFGAFAAGEVAVVKMIGVGLTVAVITDAFLIRATLMPALMTVAGRANWWAPAAIRRLHLRYGFWD